MNVKSSLHSIAKSAYSARDGGFWLDYANREDYRFLAEALLKKVAGTEMHEQLQSVATDWADSLKWRHNTETVVMAFSKYMRKLLPEFRFLLALDSVKRLLILRLLADENTSYILSNSVANDICVVTHDPSTENIRKYSEMYSKMLSLEVDYFDFMVFGEGEVDDSHYDIKITKEEWNAFTS
jgi:hypothetical protein